MAKLTKRFVDGLKSSASGGDFVVFDEDLPCFGMRMKPSGAKSWMVQYRNAYGQSRRLTLGRVGVLTPDEARKLARQILAEVAKGADPAADRRAARNAITVAELCDEYLEAGKGRIKPSTLAMDRSRITQHVKPLLGARAVASLTHADMEKFLRDVIAGRSVSAAPSDHAEKSKRPRGGQAKGGPGVASRTLGMLGTILERAVRDGILASNPVRGIARPKDRAKKLPFSIEAVAAVGRAMREREAEGENIIGLRAIRFLLLTGCRRMEALTLKWAAIDHINRCLRFEDTKSGKQTRPVGQSALELLASFRPRETKDTDYVFAGSSKNGYFVGLPKVWGRVAGRAGVNGVPPHGLRHWFASAAAGMNFSELTIAGLLGHSVKGVTARYATAPDSALLTAADRVSLRLGETLDGTETDAKVVSISRAGTAA